MPVKPYEAGVSNSQRLPGMMLLHASCDWQVWNPSMDKGSTVFRPLPQVVREENTLREVPWRDANGCFGTSFLVRERVCLGWGKDIQFTAFTDVSDPDNWKTGSPLQVFCDVLRRNPDFKYLFDRTGKSFSPISTPRVTGFLKGILIMCSGKDYRANPRSNCMLTLSSSATESFASLLELLNDPNVRTPGPALPDDPFGWNAIYQVGDPIGCAKGKIFEWDNEAKFLSQGQSQNVQLQRGVGYATPPRQKANIPIYGCRLWPQQSEMPVSIETVAEMHQTYNDVFWYMTGIEQLTQCIIPGFGASVREAVLFVFGGKDLLPSSYEFGRVYSAPSHSQPAPVQEFGQQPVTAPEAEMSWGNGSPAAVGPVGPVVPVGPVSLGRPSPVQVAQQAQQVQPVAQAPVQPPVQPVQAPAQTAVQQQPAPQPVVAPGNSGTTSDEIRARLSAMTKK